MDHARHRTVSEHWTAFRESPFLPAVVLLFILAAAAGLFAGSYCYAMANPAPRHIPMAVTGYGEARPLVTPLDAALDPPLSFRHYATYMSARAAVEEQREFAILVLL